MEELTASLKCIWNKHKVIPDTKKHVITIEIETSVQIETLVDYLTEVVNGTLATIKQGTHADEKLISINHNTN